MIQSVPMGLDLHCKVATKKYHHLTLVSGECINISKSYYKVRYLVECLGHSAFILEFYIDFDIILIFLTGDCFIDQPKLRDPFKSYEIVPSVRLQWIFTHPSM